MIYWVMYGITLQQEWTAPNGSGATPLHEAVRWEPRRIPASVLTAENMLLTDRKGETPFHWSMYTGTLGQLPLDQLPVELVAGGMMAKDRLGQTPLHLAAKAGTLSRVPKAVFTVENLMVDDNEGNTPLGLSVKYATTDCIPLGLEWPESVKEIVGEGWWERNQAVLRGKAGLDVAEEGMDVELF